MKKIFPIGDIAKLLGITPESLRHYERQGIVSPTHVAENGYRYYDTRGYTYLFFTKKYRSLGFTLQEIKELLYSDSDDVKTQKLTALRKRLCKEKKQIDLQIKGIDELKKSIAEAASQVENFDIVKTDPLWFTPIRTENGLCTSSGQLSSTKAMMENLTELQYTMIADLKRTEGELTAARTLGLSVLAGAGQAPENTSLIPSQTALRAVIKMHDGEPLVLALERTGVIRKLEELGLDMERRIYGHMINMSVEEDGIYSTLRVYIPVDILS